MSNSPLAALALVFLPCTSAFAGEITHNVQVRFDASSQNAKISVPSPGPLLGVPDSMELHMRVGLRGKVGVESLSGSDAAGAVVAGFGADLSTLDGQFVLGSSSLAIMPAKFGAFDEEADYAGASGQVMPMNANTQRRMQRLTGSALAALFESSATKETLSFKITGGASADARGPEDYSLFEDLDLVVQIQVVYRHGENAMDRLAVELPRPAPRNAGSGGEYSIAVSDRREALAPAC